MSQDGDDGLFVFFSRNLSHDTVKDAHLAGDETETLGE